MRNTYLLTWNPSKWNFEGGYFSFLQQVKNGKKPVIEWTVNSSSIQKGDELYLMRLGEEPRGIIAKGVSLSEVHLALHYDPDRAKTGEKTKHITVQFVSAVDYSTDRFLSWEFLNIHFPAQMWTPQGSGIEIKSEYVSALYDAWENCESSFKWKEDLELNDIKHNIAIIKINQTYYKGMPARELYEYTRGFWKRKIDSLKPAQYALSVVNGIVIEVYRIDKWIHASQADNIFREYIPERHANRIAFEGELAPEEVRNYYLGRRVNSLYKYGEADPVKLILAYAGSNENADGINFPMKHKGIVRKKDGSVQYICGRCGSQFIKNNRCPNCGQLVKV
jgi:hypothetical protein